MLITKNLRKHCPGMRYSNNSLTLVKAFNIFHCKYALSVGLFTECLYYRKKKKQDAQVVT